MFLTRTLSPSEPHHTLEQSQSQNRRIKGQKKKKKLRQEWRQWDPSNSDVSLLAPRLLPNEDTSVLKKPTGALPPSPPSLFSQLSDSASSLTSLQREASGSCRTLPASVPSSKVLTTVRDLNLACGTSGREGISREPSGGVALETPKAKKRLPRTTSRTLKTRRKGRRPMGKEKKGHRWKATGPSYVLFGLPVMYSTPLSFTDPYPSFRLKFRCHLLWDLGKYFLPTPTTLDKVITFCLLCWLSSLNYKILEVKGCVSLITCP